MSPHCPHSALKERKREDKHTMKVREWFILVVWSNLWDLALWKLPLKPAHHHSQSQCMPKPNPLFILARGSTLVLMFSLFVVLEPLVSLLATIPTVHHSIKQPLSAEHFTPRDIHSPVTTMLPPLVTHFTHVTPEWDPWVGPLSGTPEYPFLTLTQPSACT